MEPTIEKLLQNIPFAGMGTTLERNGLIGVIRELIKANKYTVDYILNYCESVGYQRNMAEQVFEELTGLSPKLIINNNEYYNAPIYVPACTIAWGIAKTKPNVAFYVVPGSYGYSVMEKNETEAPVEVIQMATIPEAIDELKKVAKKIQTLDKIITSKLLETEDVATIANDIDQTSKPYAAVDPIFELKKNFKNKVIDANGFEREARKLVAEEKITVDEAEDLMSWKQDLIDEDESYANEVLQHNEEWKPLDAEDIDENEPDYENRIKEAFIQLSSMIEELEIFKDYAKRSGKDRLFDAYIQLAHEVSDEWDVKPEALLGEMTLENPELVERIEKLDIDKSNEEIRNWKKSQDEFPWKGGSKKKANDEDLDSFDYLYSLLVNGNITEYKNGVKKLYQQGPSKLMEYMDWLEEYNINPKEALKVMKNASLKKVKSKFTPEQEKKFNYLWELQHQGNIPEYEKELRNMSSSEIIKFISWRGFYGKREASKKIKSELSADVKSEMEQEAQNIIKKFKPYVIKWKADDNGGSVLIGDKNSDFQAWVDVWISGNDVDCDWNQYITHINDSKEYRDLQVRNDTETVFDLATSEAIYCLEQNNVIGQDESARWFMVRNNNKNASKKVKSNNKDIIVIDTGSGYLQVFENGDTYDYGGYSVGDQLYEFSINDEDRNKGKATLDVNDLLNNKFYGIIFNDFDELEWFVQHIKDSNSKEEIKRLLIKEAKTIYSSKKVTAENMTLEDMEEEDNKTEVEKEVEKIEDTPIDELLQDTTPLDYFDEEIKNDKVDTINDVVSKCITEFSDKFKDFDKYDIKILSYKTKILDPYTTSSDEMIPDNEVNADAVLQVILAVNNKADNAEVKKLLAVFSITDGKMHWTGTVRDEDDKVVAFTDQGLDSIFNDEEPEEVEEVI